MQIRPAKPDDAGTIADIWNTIIRKSSITFTSTEKTTEDLKALIVHKNCENLGFFVAVTKEVVIGFATYGKFRDGPGYSYTAEHSVMLAPDAKGKGIGRELMIVLEDHARMNGKHTLVAGIGGENSDGISFHKALGFQKVGIIKQAGFKFDRWHDLVLMQKLL